MRAHTEPPLRPRRREESPAGALDARFPVSGRLRRQLDHVFPTHWSLMLGEISLYTFLVLLVTGVWLSVFYDPSMAQAPYAGAYPGLRGVSVSQAYRSVVDLSVQVRGGLFVRQLHYWAALVLVASVIAHLARVFFTGTFRRPREAGWFLLVVLLLASMVEGFTGHALPDDLLSGTGLRSGLSSIILSVPVVGTWLHWLLFGGEFPGGVVIPRLYVLHTLVLPAVLVGVLGLLAVLSWVQKRPQFPGPRRTEGNVVGLRFLPTYLPRSGGLLFATVGVLAVMAGAFQVNPVWKLGPYDPTQVSAGAQPDFYMALFEGLVRLWPGWELYLFGRYTVPPMFFPAVLGVGVLLTLLVLYPVIERRLTGDRAHHNLMQRPRDVPVRTASGVMALAFYGWLVLAAGSDIVALTFDVSLDVMVWAGRIGLLVLPPLVYVVTYRVCLGLQRSDRMVLSHGIETGTITRLPSGGFVEVHQPLGDGGVLPYAGARVPRRLNDLGLAGRPVAGGFFRADPVGPVPPASELHELTREPAPGAATTRDDGDGSIAAA